MQFRQLGERIGAHRRHLGPDGALIVGDVEQPAVEDRIGNRARRLEMDVAREPFPGLVHQPAAFVEEAAAVLVDHDAVGIDQHDRRRILAARIDRLACMPFQSPDMIGAEPQRHVDAVAGIEARAGRDQPHGLAAIAEMRAHHRRHCPESRRRPARWRRPASVWRAPALLDRKAGDAAVLGDDLARDAAVAERRRRPALAALVSVLTRTGPPPTG